MADSHLRHTDIGCGHDHAGALIDDDTGDGVRLQLDASQAGEEIHLVGAVFGRNNNIDGASIAGHCRIRKNTIDCLSHTGGRDVIRLTEIEIHGTILNDLGRNLAFNNGTIRNRAHGREIFLNGGSTGATLTAKKATDGDRTLSYGINGLVGTLEWHLQKNAALECL